MRVQLLHFSPYPPPNYVEALVKLADEANWIARDTISIEIYLMPLTGKTMPEPHSSQEQEEEEPRAWNPYGTTPLPGLCGTRGERLLAVIRRRRQSDQTNAGGNPCGGHADPGLRRRAGMNIRTHAVGCMIQHALETGRIKFSEASRVRTLKHWGPMRQTGLPGKSPCRTIRRRIIPQFTIRWSQEAAGPLVIYAGTMYILRCSVFGSPLLIEFFQWYYQKMIL